MSHHITACLMLATGCAAPPAIAQTAVPMEPGVLCQVQPIGTAATSTATSSTTGDPCPLGLPAASDPGASVDTGGPAASKPAKRPCKRGRTIWILPSRPGRASPLATKC